jgi:hypothetical protein
MLADPFQEFLDIFSFYNIPIGIFQDDFNLKRNSCRIVVVMIFLPEQLWFRNKKIHG